MLGYLHAATPGEPQAPQDGWYDTGDIVDIAPDGFVSITGRAKRFAKIAGEMVSMAAAEALVASLWPDSLHAVLAVPDARKGEALVLVTTRAAATVAEILAQARARGLPELSVPRTILERDALPLLASGKIDYPALQRQITQLHAQAA
jgi:acyl-[acyl-carrier-protein]-phospholipid O-acyltransferase/long-chain-fatty-acid--[acyl-carrier-protein] ligase